MDIQRLRNLTTRRLHTKMEDIYEDLEFITRNGGIMTHMIPRVLESIEPWLRTQVTDERFWEDKHDPGHVGEFPIEPMSEEECSKALERYSAMPNPLAGKKVVVVEVAK
jgi:hypothetical protein